jgi:hypothetical protein
MILGGILVGGPLLVVAMPELLRAVAGLPTYAQLSVIGLSLLAAACAAVAITTRVARAFSARLAAWDAVTERQVKDEEARQDAAWKEQIFQKGDAGRNQDTVKVATLFGGSAGANLANGEFTLNDGTLREELVGSVRQAAVKPVAADVLDLGRWPEVLQTPSGELVVFSYPSAKDHLWQVDIMHAQALPHHQPWLHNYYLGARTTVTWKIIGRGCSGLAAARKGLLSPDWPPSERTIWGYIGDAPPEDPSGDGVVAVESEKREPDLVVAAVARDGRFNDPMYQVPRKTRGLRPTRRNTQGPGTELYKPVADQIWEAEGEFFQNAGDRDQAVFVIQNGKSGGYDNFGIKRALEVMESAALLDYHPLGSRPAGAMQFADPAHIPPAIYAITIPAIEVTDASSSLLQAKRVLAPKLQVDIPFHSFDRAIPLDLRLEPIVFITGSWKAAESFLHQLNRLPCQPIVIAHWNETARTAYAVLAFALTSKELEESHWNIPRTAFADE